ncbi:MAG: phage holin family protein [Nitrospirota bacterium]
MTPDDRSLTSVLQDIIANIQDIVRSEVRLAKTELREEATKAQAVGILVAVGALCGCFGVLFALWAVMDGLARVMPDWAAALSVALPLALVAAVTISAGLKRWTHVHPPNKTIQTMKENVEWSRQHIK